MARWGNRDIRHELSPGILDMEGWGLGAENIEGMAGGEGGRGDEADVGREDDEGPEAEESGLEAGPSRVEKVGEPGRGRHIVGRAKGGEMMAHDVGHTVALGGGSTVHKERGLYKDRNAETIER